MRTSGVWKYDSILEDMLTLRYGRLAICLLYWLEVPHIITGAALLGAYLIVDVPLLL
jgi:hypothetical protein